MSPPRRASGPPAKRRGTGRFPPYVDRIVLLRIALAALAVAFLYLILKVSMIAFGGTSARATKRIEREVDLNAARPAAAVRNEPERQPGAAPVR